MTINSILRCALFDGCGVTSGAIYIFIKMYVRALRIFAVAFRMGGKVKGRAVALQNPKKGLKSTVFMIFIDDDDDFIEFL